MPDGDTQKEISCLCYFKQCKKIFNLDLTKHKNSKDFWSLLAKNKTLTNSNNTIKKL